MGGQRPVWLVGMMGVGKSTLGPPLAERLGRSFIDTDAEIEREAGRSVAEIFERQGERAFRELEVAAIERAAAAAAVVALGGGAIAQPGAPERLAAAGTVVYLRARPETLLERIGGGAEQRPLLAGLTREARLERLRTLLEEREAAYSSAAVQVDTEAWDADAIAARIAERIEQIEAPEVAP